MSRTTLFAVALVTVTLASWIAHLPRGPGAGALNLDVLLYFYPTWAETYRRIADGAVPLWNPYQLCGIPWVATLQGGTFYPLHAVYLALPLHVGLAVSHAVHLALAALATAAFARGIGLSGAAAFLAAVLFATRGLFALGPASPPALEATAWLPVGALAVVALVRGRLAGGAALLAAATALSLLAGYPQPTLYATHLWGTLVVALLVRERTGGTPALAVAGAFAAALALGLLAAGIQLLPTLELVADGAHRELSAEARAPFGPVSLADTVLASGAIAGSAFSWGLVGLMLATTGVVVGRARTLAVWAFVVTVLAVLLSLGERTPLFELYRLLPGVGEFRFPDRILGVADFTLAIAAAIGLDAVSRRARGAGLLAVAATAAVLALAWSGRAPAASLGPLAGVAVAASALIALARLRPAAAATGLVALATAEMLASPWRHLLTYDGAALARYDRFATAYRKVAERAGDDRVWFLGGGIADLQAEHALKLATRHRFRAIGDYEPLAPSRQAEWFTHLGEGTLEYRRPPWLFAGDLGTLDPPPREAPIAARRRLLDLMATRFIIVPKSVRTNRPAVQAFLDDAHLERRPFTSSALEVWENPFAAPRAFVVYRTRRAPPPATLLPLLADPEFDPLAESFVDGDVPVAATDAPVRGDAARIVLDMEDVVEVEATLARPGLVVLADAYYPGWRAMVDGVPATIVPTNHLFRGVVAPAGTHRVRLEYRPASFVAGAIASAVGWLLIGLLALRSRRGVRPLSGR